MRNKLSGYANSGMNPDEEEMLGTLLGVAPPEMQAPQQPQAASFDLQAPEQPVFSQQGGGMAGYTPPPAAKGPQFMDHVQERGFNAGDAAILAAILGSLALNKPEVSAAMAGQYGMDYAKQVDSRNKQNREIDFYNAEQSQRDPELDRWKLDQQAQQAHGNLTARNRGLDLEDAQQRRIAEQAAAEADPESGLNRGKVTMAERIANARSGVELTEAQKRSEIELAEQDKLAQLLGRGKYAAPKAAGGAAKPKSAKQEFDEARYKKMLADFQAGKINADGDPIDDKGNVIPKAKAGQGDGKLEPFADTEYENEALFNESASTGGNYQKNRQADADIASGIAAFKTMEDLLKKHGSQWGNTEQSTAITGEFDAAKGKVQAAYGVLKNLGVLQPTEAELIDKAIGADMGHGVSDVTGALGWGDLRVGKLSGARKAFEDALSRQRHAVGLRAKSAGAPAAAAAPASTGVTSGGKRLVTMKNSKTGQVETQELSERAIQRALADGWELQ